MSTILDMGLRFFGTPYIYGGNTPLKGLDCSGFVCEVLRSLGIVNGDYNAQGLHDIFQNKPETRSQLAAGALLFFGENRQTITHIAIAMDEKLMLEAGGGDHSTLTVQSAIDKDAYVRIRPIARRHDLQAVMKIEK